MVQSILPVLLNNGITSNVAEVRAIRYLWHFLKEYFKIKIVTRTLNFIFTALLLLNTVKSLIREEIIVIVISGPFLHKIYSV